MRTFRFFLSCSLATVLLALTGLALQAETLGEAVQTMIATNPDIRAAVHNRLARNQEVRQAQSGYFPTIDLVAGIGNDVVQQPFDDDLSPQQLNLSLRQNLFTGFATTNEVRRQKARVRSQAYLVGSRADNSALKTAGVYLEVLNTSSLHELAQENLLIHERIADQIQLRRESGVASTADQDQISSRLSLAQANVVNTRQNLEDARTGYLAVVGHLPEALVWPEAPDSFMPDSREEAEQLALANHPTLKSANADIQARLAQDNVARSPFMPILDLELDQIYEDQTNYSHGSREDFRAMLRLRYNLFNGFKDQARKVETLELLNEAREIRDNTQRQVVESIQLSWMAYRSNVQKISYLKKRVTSASRTAEAYSRQFKLGKRTLLDVLDAEAERIESRQQLLNAEHDLLYSKYRVLNGMGRLVKALHLQWPEASRIDKKYADETASEEADATS